MARRSPQRSRRRWHRLTEAATGNGARLGTAVSARAALEDVVEQAELVDGLGYSSLWLPEISGRDAFVTAAVLAGRTTTVQLATGVVAVPARPLPALLMAVAAAAEAASGRFTLGLGAGHAETARSQFGWPGPARLADVAAAVTAVRGLPQRRHQGKGPGGPFDLRLDGVHLAGPPPVVVGALRPRMLELAGRAADGILLNWVTVAGARRAAATARAAAGDRRIQVACYVPVAVVEDEQTRAAARAVVAHQLGSYLRLRAYGDLLAEEGFAEDVAAVRAAPGGAAERAVSARLVDAVSLVGDAAEVAAGLDRYRQAGVDEPVLAPLAAGEDPAATLAGTWAALAPG